tara:strand:+ start:5586 stop:6986 length:1401 start_codon:yes stop_codon:yes gene_type:complete
MAMQGVYRSKASPTLTALPPGLMGLYTQGAKSLAKGIEAAGEGIAGAIEKYKEGQAKREFNTKEFEALQEYADDIRMKGQYGSGGADSFPSDYTEEFAKTISKFNDMSTSQQEGAISGMKFKLSQLEKDRVFEESQRHRMVMEGQGQQRIDQSAKQFSETMGFNREKFDEANDQFWQTHGLSLQKFIEGISQFNITSGQQAEKIQLTRDQIEAARLASQAKLQMGQRDAEAIGIASGAIPVESNYEFGSKAQKDFQWRTGMSQATDASTANIIAGLKPDDESKVGTTFTDPTGATFIWTTKGSVQRVNVDEAKKMRSDFMSDPYVENNYMAGIGGNDEQYGRFLKGLFDEVKEPDKRAAYIGIAHDERKNILASTRADKYRALSDSQGYRVKGLEKNLETASRNLAAAETTEEQNKARGRIQQIEKEIEKIYEEAGRLQPSKIGPLGNQGLDGVYIPGKGMQKPGR